MLALLAVLATNPVLKDVTIPMRDGIELRADVYLPAASGRFPVLVYRTPYKKSEEFTYNERTMRAAVDRGYAVVVGDVRGRYASGGTFDPYRNEGKDGYDTVEWAASQSWSDGKVGMFGLSYPGAVQWLAAIEAPPSLRAIVPAMSISTMRHFFYYGGVFDVGWTWWIENYMNENPDGWTRNERTFLRTLPLQSMDLLRASAPYYYEWLAHPPEDPYWDFGEIRAHYGAVRAAVLNLSGWYDDAYGPQGAIDGFTGLTAARRKNADPRTTLLIGPWVHGAFQTEQNTAGSRQFADNARIDYDAVVLDWLDAYVKGSGPARGPRVRIYLMGEDRWIESDTWPLPGVAPRNLYLHPGRRLGWDAPSPAAGPQGDEGSTIVSNPLEPVLDSPDAYGAYDHRFLEGHPGVLIFDSEPLTQDVRVVGDICAELFVDADVPDFDLHVRLIDVAPDGTALNVTTAGQGVLRASSTRERSPLRLANLKTANTFLRGHKIRFQVSASWAPWFPVNLQTGLSEHVSSVTRVGRITLRHDAVQASRVVLPVLPALPTVE